MKNTFVTILDAGLRLVTSADASAARKCAEAAAEKEQARRDKEIGDLVVNKGEWLAGAKRGLADLEIFLGEDRLKNLLAKECQGAGAAAISGTGRMPLSLETVLEISNLLALRVDLLEGARREVARIQADLDCFIAENKASARRLGVL